MSSEYSSGLFCLSYISNWKHGKFIVGLGEDLDFFPLTPVQRLFQMCYLLHSYFREPMCFLTSCRSYYFRKLHLLLWVFQRL